MRRQGVLVHYDLHLKNRKALIFIFLIILVVAFELKRSQFGFLKSLQS